MWPDWVFHAMFYVALFLMGVLFIPVWRELRMVPYRIRWWAIRRKQRRRSREWEVRRRARMVEVLR
jgi:hypothetical protein